MWDPKQRSGLFTKLIRPRLAAGANCVSVCSSLTRLRPSSQGPMEINSKITTLSFAKIHTYTFCKPEVGHFCFVVAASVRCCWSQVSRSMLDRGNHNLASTVRASLDLPTETPFAERQPVRLLPFNPLAEGRAYLTGLILFPLINPTPTDNLSSLYSSLRSMLLW